MNACTALAMPRIQQALAYLHRRADARGTRMAL